jgi:putative hydrolase of the HAD superfamily
MKHWIAFDAVGTLFGMAEPVGKTYADCFSTFGFRLPESIWKNAFHEAFSATPDPAYPETGDGEAVEKEWWRDLVRNAGHATGIRPDAQTMTEAFEGLFEYYATGAAWKAFPETESVLSSLKSKGIGLGVASNFDYRIHSVMEETGLSRYFEFVLTSADVSARKPSPKLLERFMEKAEVEKGDCCLVGDSGEADGGAAQAAGIDFFHLQRPDQDLNDFVRWHHERFFG